MCSMVGDCRPAVLSQGLERGQIPGPQHPLNRAEGWSLASDAVGAGGRNAVLKGEAVSLPVSGRQGISSAPWMEAAPLTA